MFMKNLLLLLIIFTASVQVMAHEVASVDGSTTDTVEFWILEEVK